MHPKFQIQKFKSATHQMCELSEDSQLSVLQFIYL
jgi:hypothetical protein